MKIAIISDIHANLPALEAVLAHARSLKTQGFWCLGDLVQFNAFPHEVVKTIRKLGIPCIHGNIDRRVMDLRPLVKSTPFEDIPEDQQPFAWSYNQLSKKDRAYMDDLPQAMLLKFKGHRFLLTHGSPAANDDPIQLDTAEERLAELAGMTEANFILCGHTHQPFTRQSGSTVFINPGSVGRTIDHDPRASYCILDIHKGRVDAQFYRVEYNLQIAVDAIRAAGLPDLYTRMMAAAVTLDEGRAMQLAEGSG